MRSRSDTRGEVSYEVIDAIWRLREESPYVEGATLQQLAAGTDCDEEAVMYGLLDAGCAGYLETDGTLWRPRGWARSRERKQAVEEEQ